MIIKLILYSSKKYVHEPSISGGGMTDERYLRLQYSYVSW